METQVDIGKGFGHLEVGTMRRYCTGERNRREGLFSKVWLQTHLSATSSSSGKNSVLPFMVQEREIPSQREIYAPFLGR